MWCEKGKADSPGGKLNWVELGCILKYPTVVQYNTRRALHDFHCRDYDSLMYFTVPYLSGYFTILLRYLRQGVFVYLPKVPYLPHFGSQKSLTSRNVYCIPVIHV